MFFKKAYRLLQTCVRIPSLTTVLLIVGIVLLFVSPKITRADDSIVFKINISAISQCFNGIDDDQDGLIDSRDPDCTGLMDDSEGREGEISLENLLSLYLGIPLFSPGDIFGEK